MSRVSFVLAAYKATYLREAIIYEGLKRKETEWINWTTRRVHFKNFIKLRNIEIT